VAIESRVNEGGESKPSAGATRHNEKKLQAGVTISNKRSEMGFAL
jgi:hypothetical protein